VLLVAGELEPETLQKALLEADVKPLNIPAEVRPVAAIPKLGSGKTDFKAAETLAR
jgi:acyl-[acyl-carrier-protein]-phospholipid O-acyltransferase/long-chain-fatty-acid--[acyl-carrier-protein] ligase